MTIKKGDKRRNGRYGEAAWMRRLSRMAYKAWPDRRGENNANIKVTASAVRAIRRIDIISRALAKKIGRVLKIHPGYVYALKSGARWKHLLPTKRSGRGD